MPYRSPNVIAWSLHSARTGQVPQTLFAIASRRWRSALSSPSGGKKMSESMCRQSACLCQSHSSARGGGRVWVFFDIDDQILSQRLCGVCGQTPALPAWSRIRVTDSTSDRHPSRTKGDQYADPCAESTATLEDKITALNARHLAARAALSDCCDGGRIIPGCGTPRL